MRKVKFVSSLNAKMALVAAVVAGFTLTGCEKEDFNVNVPNINVDVPALPEAEDGIAYLTLTATSASGNSLEGVTFTSDGAAIAETTSYTAAKTLSVTASKDGYLSVTKTVVVPNLQKGAFVLLTTNFILNAITEDIVAEVDDTQATPIEGQEGTSVDQTSIVKGFEANVTYTENVVVNNEAPYLTQAQVNEFRKAINALTEADAVAATRATAEKVDNCEEAKEILRNLVNAYNNAPGQTIFPVSFHFDQEATSVTFEIIYKHLSAPLSFTARVGNWTWTVTGECTIDTVDEVKATGKSVVNGHAPSHDAPSHDGSHDGHGGNSNAGGGTGSGETN